MVMPDNPVCNACGAGVTEEIETCPICRASLERPDEGEDPGAEDVHPVDWGDGENDLETTETSVIHVYTDDGMYRARLVVMDDDDGEDVHYTMIRIDNRPPEVTAEVNRSAADTNVPIAFSALASDADGEIMLYQWDFDDDGVTDHSSELSANAVHSYPDDGNYEAVLTVTDDDNATNRSSVIVTVMNVAPVALGSASTDSVSTLADVIFVADGHDSDGAVMGYEWDFEDDGTFDWVSSDPETAYHSYDDDGLYVAVLRVTDDDGATALDSLEITVTNRPPEAESDMTASGGTTDVGIEFDGHGSDDDGEVVLYEWDFDGDGEYDWNSPDGAHTIFKYATEGTFEARLRVTDDDGDLDTDSVVMTVTRNRAPVADAGDDRTIDVDDPTRFDGSGSTDPDGHSITYRWDFGDGEGGNTSSLLHAYVRGGTYTVTLTVTDEGGAVGTDTCTVTVRGEKYAVVVGIADYPGHGSDLDYPDEDADYWESYLTERGYTVHKLIDSQATRDNILSEIAWMAGVEGPGSHCVFTYSGHGDHDGGSYILDYTEEGLWDHELGAAFSSFESEHIMFFFDCCASGGYDDDLRGEGRYVAEACGIHEYSLDDPDYEHGAFTYWFLISGLAAHQSWSVEDAFDHAYDHCSSDYDWDNFHPEEWDSEPGTPFRID